MRQTILDDRFSAINDSKSNTSNVYLYGRTTDEAGEVKITDLQSESNAALRNAALKHRHDIADQILQEFALNYEQERAFRLVTNHSSGPKGSPLKMYIGGMGGTGKTRVLQALVAYFKALGESYCLVVVAPTGTAAALIGGSTYHYMFGINDARGDNISNKLLSEVKSRLNGVDYVFFDEVSMLSCSDLYRCHACSMSKHVILRKPINYL
ncbi:hypothetical protein EV421DRAFT_1710922 [Armillaria borealis]|uniref:ATP-dependent DNA helicase n=1 Tax=Armillaria borealis TaxID=47425 RepID=A0AA39JFZ0_9AGAR|nr:hypothetical protein EV421DRAFT_1710922 [Armillaria borealis]